MIQATRNCAADCASAALLKIEPVFASFAHRIVGGTYTASDESGDARVFTQALAQRCVTHGAQLLYNHDVLRLEKSGNAIDSVAISAHGTGATGLNDAQTTHLKADAVVVACGSYSAPLLRTVGVDLPIYPGKGYSATFKLCQPRRAPFVSTIDDEVKCAMSRLGDELRVAGTIEVGGYDLSLTTPPARACCKMLAGRIEQVLPGVCDTRLKKESGNPRFWTGLRPATPTNIPYIGKTRVDRLWVNAGHGMLGWTHGAGSGKALAELISGTLPVMAFGFTALSAAALSSNRRLPEALLAALAARRALRCAAFSTFPLLVLLFSYSASTDWLTAGCAAAGHSASMTSNAKPTPPAAQPVDKTGRNTAASASDPPAAGKGIPARTPEPQGPQADKHPSLSDQADEASLQMPHERDQNTDMTSDAKPEPRIQQAGQDLEQGRQDTSKAVEMDKAYKKL